MTSRLFHMIALSYCGWGFYLLGDEASEWLTIAQQAYGSGHRAGFLPLPDRDPGAQALDGRDSVHPSLQNTARRTYLDGTEEEMGAARQLTALRRQLMADGWRAPEQRRVSSPQGRACNRTRQRGGEGRHHGSWLRLLEAEWPAARVRVRVRGREKQGTVGKS